MSKLRRQIASLDREAAKLRGIAGSAAMSADIEEYAARAARDKGADDPRGRTFRERMGGSRRMFERGYQWVGNETQLGIGGAHLMHGTKKIGAIRRAGIEDVTWEAFADDGGDSGHRPIFTGTRLQAEAEVEALAGNPRQGYKTQGAPRRRTEQPSTVHMGVVSVTSPGLRTACDLDATAPGMRLMSRADLRVTCEACRTSGRRPALCYCSSLADNICAFCREMGLRRNPKADVRHDVAYDILIKKPDWMIAERGGPKVIKFQQFHRDAASARAAANALVSREFGSRHHGMGGSVDPAGSVIMVKLSKKDPRTA